jgi:predicted CopG family antitoxin
MKTLQISDEVYESLKAFVVDPFDDTPNAVLMRLINIANKAQSRWCPFGARSEDRESESSVPPGTRISDTISGDMNLTL